MNKLFERLFGDQHSISHEIAIAVMAFLSFIFIIVEREMLDSTIRHHLIVSSLVLISLSIVGYIGSAFYKTKEAANNVAKLIWCTTGLTGLIPSFVVVAFSSIFLRYAVVFTQHIINFLLHGQENLLNYQENIREYFKKKSTARQEKLEKKSREEELNFRITEAKSSAYRASAPHCNECGQEIYEEKVEKQTHV